MIGNGLCDGTTNKKKRCPVHDGYSHVRKEVVDYFKNENIGDIVERMGHDEDILLKL
ncbi:MAG: hypothetical protein ACQEQ0_13780 [Bacteroidota bacterium]